MSTESNQDETSGFVCESEEPTEVETPVQDVEVNEEQASSETSNTEADVKEEVKEDNSETKAESTDKEEADSSGTNTAAEQDKAKKPNKVQKRIDEVVREREDAKREVERLKAELKERNSKQTEDKGKEPVESDFETYDEYLDALDKFDKQPDQKAEDKPGTEKKDTVEGDDLTDSQKTALAITQERVNAADKPDDFNEIALNPDLAVTGEMLEALSECDDPAKVMYHLGQNKDLATEIAGKTAIQQAREIAKLDLTVTTKPSKPVKITNAPDVIEPVNGSDAQQKPASEMSFAEFEAADRARNKQRNSTW